MRARRVAGLLAVSAVLVLGGSAVAASPAFADICKDAPAPVAPKSGLPGMLTSVPAHVPDQAPDPFTDKGVTIGEVYGFNWQWANYDLGCGNDFLRDPVAVTNTASSNMVLSLSGGVLAADASVEQLAKASSLGWLTGVVRDVSGVLRDPVLRWWFPTALLALAGLVAWRASKAAYAETARLLLVLAGASALAVFALVFPVEASQAVDRAVVAVSDAAGAQFPTSASDAITRESAYRTWLAGNFSDAESPLARELGPRLLSATHYTWSDMKRIQVDPGAKKLIDAEKAAEFKKVADTLQQQDPAGYETFTGRGDRSGPALLGLVVVVAMSLFVVVAAAMVLVARVMMQGITVAAPLAALAGIFPSHVGVLGRLWDLFTAALLAVAKFVLAGGVMTLVLGAVQASPDLGAGAKLFWIVVATVVAFVLTKPVRSLKTIVPGVDPNRSYLRDIVGKVASFYGPAMAAKTIVDATVPDAAEPAAPARGASLDPLPAPVWAAGPDEHTVTVTAPGAARPGSAHPADPLGMPGVAERVALPAAPLAIEGAPVSAGRPGDTAVSAPPAASGPDPAPTPGDPDVAVATGYVLPAREGDGMYRTDDGVLHVPGEYVPANDPEIAPDGTEQQMVTYHSTAGRSEG